MTEVEHFILFKINVLSYWWNKIIIEYIIELIEFIILVTHFDFDKIIFVRDEASKKLLLYVLRQRIMWYYYLQTLRKY